MVPIKQEYDECLITAVAMVFDIHPAKIDELKLFVGHRYPDASHHIQQIVTWALQYKRMAMINFERNPEIYDKHGEALPVKQYVSFKGLLGGRRAILYAQRGHVYAWDGEETIDPATGRVTPETIPSDVNGAYICYRLKKSLCD